MLKNFLFILSISLSINSFSSPHVMDSTGVEKKGGKTYITHKVDAKETLFSISKKYGISVDEIKKANENMSADLKVGQTILVPAKNISTVVHPSNIKTHTVESKETLYSISKKYGVSIDDLKKANSGVKIDEMKVGDVINLPEKKSSAAVTAAPVKPQTSESKSKTHIVEPKETLYSISKKYGISIDELKKANPGLGDLAIGQVLNLSPASPVVNKVEEKKVIENPVKVEEKKTETIPVVVEKKQEYQKPATIVQPVISVRPENNLPETKKDGYTKVNESGLVEMYEPNSEFHYALHKTAPMGTIIFIENPESGQKVYVRVMGRLTDGETGVIMKVSKKAFDKISKGDTKVKVNSSYIP